jgi:two-component system chemotaxis response regulator CheY
MGIKVMIVDDSAFMRNILKNFLAKTDAELIGECANGQEAVDKFNELQPSLVFMDIMMPVKTGLEALKEIRTAHADANIIMCTSVGQEKVIQESVELGAADFIIKPFREEDITTVIGKYSV